MWQNAMQQSLVLKVVSFPVPKGPAMDMWGFGCVMAELVTGEAAIVGDAAMCELWALLWGSFI
jgi:hypothetical protein